MLRGRVPQPANSAAVPNSAKASKVFMLEAPEALMDARTEAFDVAQRSSSIRRRSAPGPKPSPLLAMPRKASQPRPNATRKRRTPTEQRFGLVYDGTFALVSRRHV